MTAAPVSLHLDGRTAEVDVVFFDCDGVIFDVNPAKSAAFDDAVADYPAPARQALVTYHQQTGGISRYAKLERFFTEIYPVQDVQGEIARALERFGEFSERAYDDLVPRQEALRFARAVDAADRGYVVSGADQAELRRIFDAKGIADRFVEVLGSPAEKPHHVARVLEQRDLPPSRALFIGDGGGDFDCAEKMGLWFVFLAEMSDWADGREVVSAARHRLAERGVGAAVAETWLELEAALAPR